MLIPSHTLAELGHVGGFMLLEQLDLFLRYLSEAWCPRSACPPLCDVMSVMFSILLGLTAVSLVSL